jgi:hypothetical protein
VTVIAPDCDTDGSAQVSNLVNATLEGTLDTSVGTHTAHFVADSGHRFADGSKTKDVEYTVEGATGDCTQPPRHHSNPPKHHNNPPQSTPRVPTAIPAGMSGDSGNGISDNLALYVFGALGIVLLAGAGGAVVVLIRQRGTEK